MTGAASGHLPPNEFKDELITQENVWLDVASIQHQLMPMPIASPRLSEQDEDRRSGGQPIGDQAVDLGRPFDV